MSRAFRSEVPSDAQRTALITGASSGIGRALAHLFAQDRFDLVLVARDAERLMCLADELQKRFQISATVLPTDLSRAEAPRELYQELHRREIAIDVLVNNAGAHVFGPVQETDVEQQLQLIQLNLVSVAHLTLLLIQDMLRRGRGKILNVGSTGGFAPTPLNAVYCATKAFVLSFSEAIARDLEGTGITVTCLCPGPTRTEFMSRAGIEHLRVFQIGAMSAEQVARIGYRALMQGKVTVVPGLWNRLSIFAIRFLPRRFVTWAAKRAMQWTTTEREEAAE